MRLEQQKLNKFLEELTELSKAHGLAIGGCGCCGSPFVYNDGDGAEDFSKQHYILRGPVMDGGADGLEFTEVRG
jgi:hypothetical protein